MSTTPLLGITELTTNQSGKETTINSAILALESATNGALVVSMAAGNVTLSAAQFTGSFIFSLSGATVQRTLNLPAQVNGVNVQRLFAVRNTSAYPAVIQVTGAPGTTVTIPTGESRLLDVDGSGNVRVVTMPPKFTALSDAPATYTGQSKKIVRVKSTEDGLEFRSPQLADLSTDVDITTTPPSDGMALVYSAGQSKWIPGSVATGGGGGGSSSGVASMQAKSASGMSALFPTVGNSPTITEVDGKGLYFTGAAATAQLRYALKALPAADTTIICAVRGSLLANNNAIGLIIRDSTSGKSITNVLSFVTGPSVQAEKWTSDTAFSAATTVAGDELEDMAWLKIVYTNATKTIACYYSADGVTWVAGLSDNVTLTNPSHMGLVYESRSTTIQGGGYVMYYNDGAQAFDFDPFSVMSMNVGTVSLSYRIAFGFEDNIATANYIIGRHTCVETFTIPANFANSVASIALNPLATMTITIKKNGTSIGTVTISTSGVITFATTGGATINCLTGDVLTASVGASDANAAGFAMTFKA